MTKRFCIRESGESSPNHRHLEAPSNGFLTGFTQVVVPQGQHQPNDSSRAWPAMGIASCGFAKLAGDSAQRCTARLGRLGPKLHFGVPLQNQRLTQGRAGGRSGAVPEPVQQHFLTVLMLALAR
jgi:hypothetical protein